MTNTESSIPLNSQNPVSLEIAISIILNSSIKDIAAALQQFPPNELAKLLIAVGKIWQDEKEG